MIAWHYTSAEVYDKVKRDGCMKSSALLVSEKLRARPDWDEIKNDQQKLRELLPAGMRCDTSIERYPIIWFSVNPVWEPRALPLRDEMPDAAHDFLRNE